MLISMIGSAFHSTTLGEPLPRSKQSNFYIGQQVVLNLKKIISFYFILRIGQAIFLKLNGNDYLKEMTVQQLFCEPCQRFLSDRFVEGTCPSCKYEDARGDQCDKCGRLTNSTELLNPRCKVCNSKNVIIKESEQVGFVTVIIYLLLKVKQSNYNRIET